MKRLLTVPAPRTHSREVLRIYRRELEGLLAQHTRRWHALTREQPVCMAVQADSGVILILEFHVADECVYVWSDDEYLGGLHRDAMYHWLTNPCAAVMIADARLSLAFTEVSGVTVSVPGATACPVSASSIAELRHRLGR